MSIRADRQKKNGSVHTDAGTVTDRDCFQQDSERQRKQLISEAVAANQLFFAISCTMNYKPCIEAMRWFREYIVFSRDYTLTQDILHKLEKGLGAIYQQSIEDATEAFAGAYDECASLAEDIANMIWLMFISYALMPDEHSIKMGEAVLYGKALKKDFVKNYVLKDANPISKENNANKREYVRDSQEGMLQLIRLLKQSEKYGDLADYYLTMRYVIGMVANDYSDDLNKTIGMEMLTAYASLGNKYVLNYFRAVQEI